MSAIPFVAYQLIEARMALKINIERGTSPTRFTTPEIIISWLYRNSVTDVLPPYTIGRKIQAWNDLNSHMIRHGFHSKELKVPSDRPGK